MKNLEKLAKLLPLGAALLIFLGVLRVSIYYNYFGVDIMSYLSTGEVITAFLNDSQAIIVLTLIGIVHVNSSERIIEKIEESIGKELVLNMIRRRKWRYTAFFFLLLLLIIGVIYFQWLSLETWLIYLFLFCSAQLVVFLFIRKEGEDFIKSEFFMNVFLSICLVSIIPLMALKDIREVENYKNQGVVLTFEDKTQLRSSKQNRYVGKAGEYYFFYSPTKKKATIIKAENVERIEIGR